jgi:hypothetical protein
MDSHDFSRIVRYLRPLAVAQNITQAANCRPDEVLISFGILSATFGRMSSQEDEAARQTCLQSLEKRWKSTDQVIFIVSALLNPFIQTTPFNTRSQLFATASIVTMLDYLYLRFYGTSAPRGQLLAEYTEYTKGVPEP